MGTLPRIVLPSGGFEQIRTASRSLGKGRQQEAEGLHLRGRGASTIRRTAPAIHPWCYGRTLREHGSLTRPIMGV